MVYRSCASRKIWARGLVVPLIFLLIFLFSSLGNGVGSFDVMALVFAVFAASVQYFSNRSAYCLFEMTKNCLSNAHISYKWENLPKYYLCRVEEKGRKGFFEKEHASFVCFGGTVVKDFTRLSPKTSIFFAMTPKNMKKLAEFAKGKSPVVDEFLAQYYDVVCREKQKGE